MKLLFLGWCIINVMAGVGAVWMLGEAAWTYMVFIGMYFYYIHKIGEGLKK